MDLDGKVAVVTGGASGIGRAIATALAIRGATIAIADIDQSLAMETSQALEAEDYVTGIFMCDVSDKSQVERLFNGVVTTYGHVDILVNNVGRAGGSGVVETTDDEWQSAFNETLFPAIRASRLAVPHLRKRGGGVILMIASIWGRESGGRMTYNAVKASEISLAKSMAQQLAADNIRVNSVAPGSISFPGGTWHRRQQSDPEAMKEFVREHLPFGRFGRAEEVGAVVAFLASARASWISGASVTVDGCQSKSLF